jgi:hypothetical protein
MSGSVLLWNFVRRYLLILILDPPTELDAANVSLVSSIVWCISAGIELERVRVAEIALKPSVLSAMLPSSTLVVFSLSSIAR